jgi:hypothetical protein
MYWDFDPQSKNGLEHTSIVIKKTGNDARHIFYTAHSYKVNNKPVSSGLGILRQSTPASPSALRIEFSG